MTSAPGAGGFRSVAALPINGIVPNDVGPDRPTLQWVDPTVLKVEEPYQRDLGEKSIRLIRRIVSGWDWKAMKPPICAVGPGGSLVVIDGQHTAIAAASHPGISAIPVMVVNGVDIAARANAFVKHNSDRIAMTPMQVHYAALTAGNEVAVAMAEACRRAGAQILRNPPSHAAFKVGDTVAVATIKMLTARLGVVFTARALRILVHAKRGPVGTLEIRAVAMLLSEPEWKGEILDEDLSTLIRSKPARAWISHAETHVRRGLRMPLFRALAIDWFKLAPKRREAA